MANYGVLTTNLLSMITGLDKSITGSSDRAIVLGDVPNIAVYVFQQYFNRSAPYQYAQFVGIPSILPETVNSCITINNVALYLSHIAWSDNDSGTGTKSDPIRTIKAAGNSIYYSFTLIYAAEQRITSQPSEFSTPISATLTVDSSTYTGIITKSSSTYYSGFDGFGGNIYLIKFRRLAPTYSKHVTGYVDIVNSFNIPASTKWVERAYVTYYTPCGSINSEYFYEMQDFCGASSEQIFYIDHKSYRTATLASERYFFPHSMERNNDNELVNIEGNKPEPHENATKVILYKYTAKRLNGVAIADLERGLTAEQAQKADGKYFTTDSNLGASDGTNLQYTANGWYIKPDATIYRDDYGFGMEVELYGKIKCTRYYLIYYIFTNGAHYADVFSSYAKRVYINGVESKTECT